jgi:hypothetical protein
MRRIAIAGFVFLLMLCAACGGGGGGSSKPKTGTLAVTVVKAGATPEVPVAGARVEVLDGDTGDILSVLSTDLLGKASVAYTPRQVLVKVYAQGYLPSPASPSILPLPYQITLGATTTADISLEPLDPAVTATLGTVTGKVAIDGAGVADAVVFANSGSTWLTATTDADGNYIIYNVPAGSVFLNAYSVGYNFQPETVTVVSGASTPNADMASTGVADGVITGTVTFLAAENGVVDVTLLHPATRIVIPGMSVMIDPDTRAYSLTGVPDGTYEIVASLKTDGYVLDPDYIVKNGVPVVSVVSDSQVKDFAVTDTFLITAPAKMETVPLDNAAFAWQAYPGVTEGYALEVVDESGNVIWGGFDESDLPRFFVAPARLSATFDEDGSAIAPLEEGRIYQVRIYAMKSDNRDPRGFILISMTEDLEGLFVAGPVVP